MHINVQRMLEKIKTKNLRVALLKEGVGVKCGGG
jgi:hypothetical protein